jgi:hypothetical protein
VRHAARRRRRAPINAAAHTAPSAKPSEPCGMPPPTEQPLELDESLLELLVPALEVPALELEVPAADAPALPAVPDAPPAPLASVVFVHWNIALLHVAPSAAHLQCESSVHQPSMPEPAVVAGWQVCILVQSQISPPHVGPVLQSMSFVHASPVACAAWGAKSAAAKSPITPKYRRIVAI